MPSVSSYVYVLAVAAVLLLPDVQRLKIGNVEFERLAQIVDAAGVARLVRRGDTPENSEEAQQVVQELFGDGA